MNSYNKIYEVCQPVIDWLNENYPHNHKIVITTSGAELMETGKLVVPSKELKDLIEKGMPTPDQNTSKAVNAFCEFMESVMHE